MVLVTSAAAALVVPAALAAERMWIGYHDDPSFRWVSDRESRIVSSAKEGATVMRLLVRWNQTVPRRPANASDPFDPSYNLDDLDEAIRTAQEADTEVVLTLFGTPRWANGNQGPNAMPRRVADFGAFARALASRYSGRVTSRRGPDAAADDPRCLMARSRMRTGCLPAAHSRMSTVIRSLVTAARRSPGELTQGGLS